MPKKKTRPAMAEQLPVPAELIERRIYFIRGQKVMLDRDLAELYNVKAIALRQQVKRNQQRFPPDFMFQLTAKEAEALVSQNVISSRRSFSRALPYVFTQEGVAMLSSVLTSSRAVQVNIAIMRAFVRLREVLATHKDLALEIEKLKHEQQNQGKQIKQVFLIIEKLLEEPAPEPEPRRRAIGFRQAGE